MTNKEVVERAKTLIADAKRHHAGGHIQLVELLHLETQLLLVIATANPRVTYDGNAI